MKTFITYLIESLLLENEGFEVKLRPNLTQGNVVQNIINTFAVSFSNKVKDFASTGTTIRNPALIIFDAIRHSLTNYEELSTSLKRQQIDRRIWVEVRDQLLEQVIKISGDIIGMLPNEFKIRYQKANPQHYDRVTIRKMDLQAELMRYKMKRIRDKITDGIKYQGLARSQ